MGRGNQKCLVLTFRSGFKSPYGKKGNKKGAVGILGQGI